MTIAPAESQVANTSRSTPAHFGTSGRPERGVQHHPNRRITHNQPAMGRVVAGNSEMRMSCLGRRDQKM